MRFCARDDPNDLSEDIKVAVCRCLAALFKAATNENLLEVWFELMNCGFFNEVDSSLTSV